MTQPNDPWAAASATPPSTIPATGITSTMTASDQPAESMAGGFGPAGGSSLLFSQGPSAPSLFNKTHFLGTERSGIIKATEDKQDQDFNAKMPKYWSTSKVGGENRNRAITTDAIDAPTGQPNRPVMVCHVTLQTEYRMDQNEALAVKRPADYGTTVDTGERVEVIGGLDFKAFQEAMLDARNRGIALTGPQDLVGLKLTVKRVGQKPNPGGNPSWIKSYRLDRV